MRNMSFRAMFCIALLAVTAQFGFAQFSSAIQGIVQDQTGAVIPNATVTLTNLSTGVSLKTQSSESGVYRFSSLAPTRYEVTAQAAGLEMKPVEVTLLTDQTAGVNLNLAVSGSAQQIVVTDQTPAISTDDSRLQTTVRTEQLHDLPLQGRNFLGLVAVAPGITGHGAVGNGAPGDAPDNFSTEKTVDASGNGRNYSGNQFTLDGLNITSNILQGTANLTPNPDSVQEMAVQTNTFNVEHGRGSSVQVAITTKAGSNQFHGTASYFFSNQHLWARTEFTKEYGPFKKHDFAATLGGPIIKNHTFFFGSVEPLRSQVSQAGSVQTFESPEFVSFAQQHFPNTIGTQILTQYPLANVGITGVNKTAQDIFGGTCGTAATAFMPCNMPLIDEGRFQPSPFRNALQYNGRLDQYFRDGRDRFYFNLYKVDLDTETIPNRTGFYDVGNNNTNAYQLSYTHLFSSTVINDFSYGQIRVQGSSGATPGIPFHVPDISVDQQNIGISPPWGPATFIQHNYNWRDVVSWVKGSHSLKFGFEYWTGDDDAQFAGPYERPTFNFRNLLDLVQDKPYQESGVNFNPVTGQVSNGAYRHLLATEGLFVQDEWKVKPNLTVTYGIRWDDYGNPHADLKTGLEGNVFPGPGATLNEKFANASVRNVANVYATRLANNWSPRIGVAFDPSKTGNWVIRGGVGLYHDWIPLGEANRVRQNPPGLITPTFRAGDPTPPIFSLGTSDTPPFGFQFPTIPVGAVDAHGGVVGIRASAGGIDRHIHPDNVVIYNAGVEHRLRWNFVAGATYSGSHLWDGVLGTDFNRFPGDLLDGSLDRLNPSFGTIYYEFNGNEVKYNAMILTLRRQAGPTSFQVSYTLSKVTDFGQAGTRVNRDPGYAVPTQYNLQQYEAPADWDARHRLSLAGTWNLPSPRGFLKYVVGGWEIGSVAILQSGTPLTIFTDAPFDPVLDPSGKVIGLKPNSGDYNADGVNFDFPNAPSQSLPSSFNRQQYINGIFSKSAFGLPTPGTEGNLKRASFRNPGFINVDANLIKNIPFETWGRTMNLQFRFEFFNVLNRVNLQNVQGNLNSATFGRSTGTFDPRIIQLGARFAF
jgi:Carboxypeptidase regulatory-like domain/TonB dependent receptor